VVVMYAGRVVETGDVHTIFRQPRHPYTIGLISSLPQSTGERRQLRPIPGNPPDLSNIPPGCSFHPRCRLAKGRERCRAELPALVPVESGMVGHLSACHFWNEITSEKEISAGSERFG
ncbi:MAG: oligopeptide/dipeptide ABC transporter ATP-binding protein, partial [Acetobacteraceae bacterium]